MAEDERGQRGRAGPGACSARWAGPPQPPDGRRGDAGALGVAGRPGQRGRGPGRRDGAARRRGRTWPASSAELDRRAEAQHVPVGPGRHGRRRCTRPRAWSGTRSRCSASTRASLPFVLATSPGAGRRGAPAALRRDHPGPRAPAGLLVPHPQRRRPRSASRPASWIRCCRTPSRRAAPAAPARRGRGASLLSAHCRSCGHPLSDAAERKIGRHAGCPATYDERTMVLLKEWRRQEAAEREAARRSASSPTPPWSPSPRRGRATPAELIKVQGLGPAKAEQVRRAGAGHPGRARRPPVGVDAGSWREIVAETGRNSVCAGAGYSPSLIKDLVGLTSSMITSRPHPERR